MTTLYETLGVRPEATSQEIKSAFRSLALRYHPDRCKEPHAKEMFIAVRAAYEILADAEKRAAYDHILAGHTRRAPNPPPAPREHAPAPDPFGRWQAEARQKAEQEAGLSYADFVNKALVSALKLGGDIVVALGQGALLGALSAVLRVLTGLAIALPLGAFFLSMAVHPALLLLTGPLGAGWAFWLVRQRTAKQWTWTAVGIYFGGLAAFCAICVGLFSGMLRKSEEERAHQKTHFELTLGDLRSHIPDYSRAFPATGAEAEPKALGKMVIIDMEKRDFHWTFEKTLPDAMRPHSHSEVDFVLQARCQRERVGQYSRGGSGYQWRCRYSLIDFRAGREVLAGSIEGTPPPQTKRYSGDASGSLPLEELVARLVARYRLQDSPGASREQATAESH